MPIVKGVGEAVRRSSILQFFSLNIAFFGVCFSYFLVQAFSQAEAPFRKLKLALPDWAGLWCQANAWKLWSRIVGFSLCFFQNVSKKAFETCLGSLE